MDYINIISLNFFGLNNNAKYINNIPEKYNIISLCELWVKNKSDVEDALYNNQGEKKLFSRLTKNIWIQKTLHIEVEPVVVDLGY